jgi:hypothetical protein
MFHKNAAGTRDREPAGHIRLALNNADDLKKAVIKSKKSPMKSYF